MPEKKNSYNEPKRERICNICGIIYSAVITENCPFCDLVKELQELQELREKVKKYGKQRKEKNR